MHFLNNRQEKTFISWKVTLFQNYGENDTDKLNQDHLKFVKYNDNTFVWIKYTLKSLTENLYKH